MNTIALKIVEFANCLIGKNDISSQSMIKGIKTVFDIERMLKQTDEEIIDKLNDSIPVTKSASHFLSESLQYLSESDYHHKHGILFHHFIYKDNVFTSSHGSLYKVATTKKTEVYKHFKCKGGVIVKSRSRMLRYMFLHRICMDRANRKFRNWVY